MSRDLGAQEYVLLQLRVKNEKFRAMSAYRYCPLFQVRWGGASTYPQLVTCRLRLHARLSTAYAQPDAYSYMYAARTAYHCYMPAIHT